MRKMVFLAVLLTTTALAGCTDDDKVTPPATEDLDAGPQVGQSQRWTLLGSFTWGDPAQQLGTSRGQETLAMFEIPANATAISVHAERDHRGVERETSSISVIPGGALAASINLPRATGVPTTGWSSADIETLTGDIPTVTIEYAYDTQPPGTVHNIELEVRVLVPWET